MNFKKVLALIMSILMLFSALAVLFSCDKDPQECTEHIDEDKDGKCDVCQADMSSTIICNQHIDANADGKCDNCGADTTSSTPASGKTTYTVKVETVAGMPLEGVTVYIHNSDGYSICTLPQNTDKNGVAKFELETGSNYSIQLDGVPEGYKVKGGQTKDDRYPMTPTGANIMLSSAPIKGDKFATTYELGDVMHDFTLTDVDGNEYNLSSLLEEKRMVMLNFWYVECSWCLKEFPGINASYKNYKDQIEILALNDYGDSVNEIKYFPTTGTFEGEENNLTFPFFKIEKNTNNLILDKFEPDASKRGYPTTVIIDRYGVVCFIESGAIVGQAKWDKIFAHFTADDYDQKLIENAEDLTPPELPNIEWGGSDKIAESLNKGDILVEYAPETNEKDKLYSWPFIPTTVGSHTAVRPSNNSDNSYAIMYANVQLKPGQAVMFDYFSSCDYGNDKLVVLVDKKDICTLTGVNTADKTDLSNWEECCAYVDPRPITTSNKDDLATYSVAFVYTKDSDTSAGDDTVYLKNLRVVSVDDITTETYIFRYATTDPTSRGDAYNTYVDYVLHTDGYYHVKNADDSVGPLLLVSFLGYTNFDSKQTMSQRLTGAEELIVNDENVYKYWMIYANASSNSKINGHTPVTKELKEMLDAYCDTYRMQAGKSDHEDLWLQMCIYYDAYGKTEDGNPTPPVENPIKGLTTFSAFETKLDDPKPGDKANFSVTYTGPIMPRGYLYKFVPTVSGVYRITSKSKSEVTGWIFTGSSHDWADLGNGERNLLTSSEREERFCPELNYEDENGNTVRDVKNLSMVVYMEKGQEYYIDIAYYDIYEAGTFEFELKYVGEKFDAFVMASPGPVTYIESASGGISGLIAIGIDYAFKEEGGVKYAYQVLERDKNNNPTKWGDKIYADFYYPTIPFPSQSIVEIAEIGAFDFSISELDVDAISHLEYIRSTGKSDILAQWIADGTASTADAAKELWAEKELDEIMKLLQKGASTSSYDAADVAIAEEALEIGTYALKESWGKDNIGNEDWDELNMDDALRGSLASDEATKKKQQEVLDDIEHLWTNIYKMDDVAKGKYHGDGKNMTETIQKYIDLMEDDVQYGERQGCVAVTEELAGILSDLFSKYVFDDVQHDWLKFCYYYDQLGA